MTIGTVVTFSMNDALFALPVARVQEILDARTIAPLPNAPDYLLGLIDVRGASVAVVDLRRLMGEPPREDTQDTRIIVFHAGDGPDGFVAALRTDRVIEVAELDEAPAGEVPISDRLQWRARIVEEIGRREGAFVSVLDSGRLLAQPAAAAAIEPLGAAT
ncbi:chemotaxis protein CheW [Tranquillimonas alkanivorans]|uniref:Purine-binding chemotaxis protein CheW n=1 Tax=Tranquillimonas alkanivorans TaxID=441119 RepID=A0A1I5M4E3_9RHOB|nr:chemotaxis protein CheW [Tranquillimonas alkanivorans]SFP04363.1 purine-binding chemotaxis protein CheW [Tranquillimonas alkanivorans]